MPIDPAAGHMATALKAIYAQNSCPDLRRFPSGGVLLNTGEQDLFGNFAIGLEGDEWSEAAQILSPIEAPTGFLDTGDFDSEMALLVGAHGYAPVASIPSMTVELDRLPDVPLADGYVFERVTSSDDGVAWSRVLSEGYPVPIKSAESMSPVHARVEDADDAAIQFFRVVRDGETAGISGLILADGVAGVYCVTTLEAHRRRGLGAVLTAWPLLRGRDLGYSTGVLQASEAGYPVYKKLGFVDTGAVHLYMKGESAH